MGWGCSGSLGLVILVILELCHGQADLWKAGTEAIQYRYNCGDHGLQLLVFPSHGQEVQLKVLGEDNTLFSCKILNWSRNISCNKRTLGAVGGFILATHSNSF